MQTLTPMSGAKASEQNTFLIALISVSNFTGKVTNYDELLSTQKNMTIVNGIELMLRTECFRSGLNLNIP